MIEKGVFYMKKKKGMILLLCFYFLFFFSSERVVAVSWERDEIFAFLQAADKHQFDQVGKKFASKKAVEDELSLYYTREYSRFLIEEMYWYMDGYWSLIPTDFIIGDIPPFSYDERTKIDYAHYDVIVSELIPANDFGPVTWDEYVATVTIARTKDGWIVKDLGRYFARQKFIDIYIDGLYVPTDEAPFIENGRVLVPIRSLFEAMDQRVEWNPNTKTISIDDGIVTLQIGSKKATVRNEIVTLDVPAQIVNGRTFVPLRFIVEHLGKNVYWDGKNRIVDITSIY